MTIAFAAGAAALAIACAAGHSTLIERRLLRPLFREPQAGLLARRSARDLIRFLVHLPSLAWVVLGCAVCLSRLDGGDRWVSLAAGIVFAATGIGNAAALRKPHVGALLILGAACLTLADWIVHA